jgi:Cu-Zn family superoxide dismutase
MRTKYLIFLLSLAFTFTACKNTSEKDKSEESEEVVESKAETITMSIPLEPRSGSEASGKVVFTEENGIVTMYGEVHGLTSGLHAVHLHESSDCSDPEGMSTGGHWNPTFERHGKWGDAEGYHKGDIGNFKADENGFGVINFATDQWCIGCGDETKDILGKSVIVHEGVDDFVTQPTGDAGGRISCGGIIQ